MFSPESSLGISLVLVPLLQCCLSNEVKKIGEQGWHSGESTHLPPMWPRVDSRSQRHMWVEFVVGSLLAPRGFSLCTLVFPSPQKPTLPNSNRPISIY